jgi:pyrroline-5-carboxylate reductase
MSDEFPRLGFLGAGKMAAALVRGVLAAGLTTPDRIYVSSAREESRRGLARTTNVQAVDSNCEVVGKSEVVVLAVKPQVAATVLREIAPAVQERHLLISVVAGLRLATMQAILGPRVRLVRAMPNTPCLVGASATAYCSGSTARPEDCALVERIFQAVGECLAVPEEWLDAVTGLSGSGPAYVAVVIEALTDGGVRAGLPREVAYRLTLQTVLGTVRLLRECQLHPAQLKDQVASPGGTTIAGLHRLEEGGLRAALINAVVAATERARQLGAVGNAACASQAPAASD